MAYRMRRVIVQADVIQGKHALGAVVDLKHLPDAEALTEPVPHIRTQAVPEDGVHIVLFIER